jgi:hypothetical protein
MVVASHTLAEHVCLYQWVDSVANANVFEFPRKITAFVYGYIKKM